jgi:hypothetical protein
VYASSRIQTKKTKYDGLLFLIKHLLIMREQITPFNISQSSSETALDFSHLKHVLAPSERTFDKMVRSPFPDVREKQLDYRKEADRLLKTTCEAFIHEATRNVMSPVLSVLPKVSVCDRKMT